MGKNKHCTYCVEFYQKTPGYYWDSGRSVELRGCDKCHSRHGEEVYALKAKLKSLELALDRNNLVVNELTADNNQQRKKVQFLQHCRDSLPGEDVVLAIGPGLEVTAHGTILAAKSPVFKRMVLNSKPANSNQDKMVIHINDVPHPVLEAVVDFLYSGEITFSDLVRSDEVLKAAHTFELGLLREYCDVELCRALTVDNVPRMLKLARKFEASRLQEEAGELFKEHFDILKSQVYEILEGPDDCTILIAESSSGACPELDGQWNEI